MRAIEEELNLLPVVLNKTVFVTKPSMNSGGGSHRQPTGTLVKTIKCLDSQLKMAGYSNTYSGDLTTTVASFLYKIPQNARRCKEEKITEREEKNTV